MFKGHPKGLFVAFFSNMGERFGFYTMYAIFVLYIQAKFGIDPKWIWSIFLAAVYIGPLLGGYIADRWLGYGNSIKVGLVVMFLGYALLFYPGTKLPVVYTSLGFIALGTGFFKGNLQALVGNMYDDPKYSSLRDSAFMIFYMGINIGAFFAPHAATAMVNWNMARNGIFYDASIPALAHQFLHGNISVQGELSKLALAQGPHYNDLTAFSTHYIKTIGDSYNYAFGLAALTMILSMIVFLVFRKHYKAADITETEKAKNKDLASELVTLTKEQTRSRLSALGLVFITVVFFWMSFQQNGLTLTYFAHDFTVGSVSAITYIFFSLKSFLPLILAFIGLMMLVSKGEKWTRITGTVLLIAGPILSYLVYKGFGTHNAIQPHEFQQFNPLFIVLFTPVVLAIFSLLRKNGKEPSSPKKIGIGMLLAAVAFAIMIFPALGLQSPKSLGGPGQVSSTLVSPYWLISSYYVLTIAELFLSPIGISFVSRVAPPKYKGLMQGGWFAATAAGNLLVGVMGYFWTVVSLPVFFSILVGACLLSAAFIFTILKKLEKAAEA
jgi:proton-dependent oligopeptide transporter, POT family